MDIIHECYDLIRQTDLWFFSLFPCVYKVMEEDSGQLLDSDLDSSQSQFPSQADSSAAGSAGHPVKNYRSKSLPAPFFPPIPNFNGQPSSASTSSSAAAGDNSHKRTNSTRTSNEEDDDFVIIRDDRRRVAAAGQGIKHSKLRDQVVHLLLHTYSNPIAAC